MKISDVMTAEPQAAQAGDSLQEVAGQMQQGDFGSMPVLDNGRLAGVVTDRDIAVRGVARGLAPNEPVSRVMTAPAITAAPETEVLAALGMMTQKRIRHLPVVSGGRIAGIVSIGDLVKFRIERIEQEAEAMRAYIQSV